jgi:hypothetical protein
VRNNRVAPAIITAYLIALAIAIYSVNAFDDVDAVPTHHRQDTTLWKSLALAAFRIPTTTTTDHSAPMDESYRAGIHTMAAFASAVDAYKLTQLTAATVAAEEQAAAAASSTTSGSTSPQSTTTPTPASYSIPSASASSTSSSSGGLSFGLFPCIEIAESGGNASVHSGLYGDLDSTWAGYDGYPYAGAAPVSVQNTFNLNLYNADGYAPWNDYCTGR